MFRTEGFVFRKTIVYTIMVRYCVLYTHQYRLSEYTLLPTRLLILMHLKHTIP